jgi:NitT/TauT family transport system substrate-binding protein
MEGNDVIQQSFGLKAGMAVKSLAFVAMLAVLVVFGGGPLNVAAESQPITIAVTPDAAALDAYTAQEKGYFKSVGLNVTIKFITDISQLPPVINAGQYEIGNIVPTIILRAAAQGIPLTAICGDHVSTREKPSFTIVTLASSDINSLTDLKGHTVGSPAVGGGFSISMLYYLQRHGIDPKSVQQIQSTGASLPGLLDNHRVDAILSQSPYSLKVQGPKYRDLGSPLTAMSDHLQTTLYVSKQSWAADNRETVVAFCSALGKADAYINSHEDDAKFLLAQLAGLSPEDAKAFRLDIYDATIPPDTMKVWLDAMNSLNLLPKPVDPIPLIFH